MKLYPDLAQVLRLKEEGVYRAVPVSCEIFSDLCTPVQLIRKLKNVSTHVFMLESAEAQENWGRYTFLFSAGSWRNTGRPAFPGFHPSPAAWSDISPMTTLAIPSPPSGGKRRIRSIFRTWT